MKVKLKSNLWTKAKSIVWFFSFLQSLNLKISEENGNVFSSLYFSLIVFAQMQYHGISYILTVFSFLVAYIKVCALPPAYTLGTMRTNKITSKIMFLLSYCEYFFSYWEHLVHGIMCIGNKSSTAFSYGKVFTAIWAGCWWWSHSYHKQKINLNSGNISSTWGSALSKSPSKCSVCLSPLCRF